MRIPERARHLMLLALVSTVSASASESERSPGEPITKGGDDRTGEYDEVEGWWKPAPDHDDVWGCGQVSGVAVDNPDRIIVGVWGDRDAQNQERAGSSNYLVVVDGDGNITEN